MGLVQISRRTRVIERVPREHGEPVIELDLARHEDVVGVKLLPSVDRADAADLRTQAETAAAVRAAAEGDA